MTHQLTQVWDAKGPVPGQWRARQNNQVPYMVEMRLRVYMTCNSCGGLECMAPGHVGRTHWAQIMKFGRNTEFVGQAIASPRFSTFYRLYTGRELPGNDNGSDNGSDGGKS